MKKLEFAKYYDVTEIAKLVSPEYTHEKIWICRDSLNYWVCRIVKGYRYDDDEGYVESEGSYILERNNVDYNNRTEPFNLKSIVNVLYNDAENGFENWDCFNVDSIEEAIEDYIKEFNEDVKVYELNDVKRNLIKVYVESAIEKSRL